MLKCLNVFMILIVGLGNPGRKYKYTRHNLGFQVTDEFCRKNNFSIFKFSKKFNALISEGSLDNQKIIIAKPQTFMNESGKAVKFLVREFLVKKRIDSAMAELIRHNLWVVHDDIDLPLDKIRISKGRGAGGHKGVESIIKELGTKNFVRFRVGVKDYKSGIKNTKKFVLEKFQKDEEKMIKKTMERACQTIRFALKEGIEKAMTEYNAREVI